MLDFRTHMDDIMTIVYVEEEHRISRVKGCACVRLATQGRVVFKGVRVTVRVLLKVAM
jgi:hypothetical protein